MYDVDFIRSESRVRGYYFYRVFRFYRFVYDLEYGDDIVIGIEIWIED